MSFSMSLLPAPAGLKSPPPTRIPIASRPGLGVQRSSPASAFSAKSKSFSISTPKGANLLPVVAKASQGNKISGEDNWWADAVPELNSEVGKELYLTLLKGDPSKVLADGLKWIEDHKEKDLLYVQEDLFETLCEVKYLAVVSRCCSEGLNLLRSARETQSESNHDKIELFLLEKLGSGGLVNNNRIPNGSRGVYDSLTLFRYREGLQKAGECARSKTYLKPTYRTLEVMLSMRIRTLFKPSAMAGPVILKPPNPPAGAVHSLIAFLTDGVLFGYLG